MKKISFGLYLLVLFIIMIIPLKPLINALMPDFVYDISTNKTKSDSAIVTSGHSKHFTLISNDGYLNKTETDKYLVEAEKRRDLLVNYLGITTNMAVTVNIFSCEGTAHNYGSDIYLYDIKNGENYFVHELTHSFMGYANPFLSEGLAVYVDRKFCWEQKAAYLVPVNNHLRGQELLSVNDLAAMNVLAWRDCSKYVKNIRYLTAGSFVQYLIEKYGIQKFEQVYNNSLFYGTYGLTLHELENNWKKSVYVGNFIHVLLFNLFGLLCVGGMFMAMKRFFPWIIPLMISLFAFFFWSLYLVYPLRVFTLLLGIGAVSFGINRFNKRMSFLFLWGTGGILFLVNIVIAGTFFLHHI